MKSICMLLLSLASAPAFATEPVARNPFEVTGRTAEGSFNGSFIEMTETGSKDERRVDLVVNATGAISRWRRAKDTRDKLTVTLTLRGSPQRQIKLSEAIVKSVDVVVTGASPEHKGSETAHVVIVAEKAVETLQP